MKNNGRTSAQVRYKVGVAIRTAGPAPDTATLRRRRTLQRLHSGWRRRIGATGLLVVLIAVTVAVAG